MDVKSPYPANLCPLSYWVEFAGFGEDLGQAIGEPIEAMSGRAVRQRATDDVYGAPLFLREDKADGNDERISLESLTSGVRLLKEIVLAVQ